MSADKKTRHLLFSALKYGKKHTDTNTPNQQAKLKQHVDDTATLKLGVGQREKKRKCCKSLKRHNLWVEKVKITCRHFSLDSVCVSKK